MDVYSMVCVNPLAEEINLQTAVKTAQRYIAEQIVINIVVNILMALLIGWSMMGHLDTVPMQLSSDALFDPSMAGDILVGSFLLGFILTLIVTTLTRNALSKAYIEGTTLVGWSAKLPQPLFKRALMLGVLSMVTAGLTLVLTMLMLGLDQMKTLEYVIFHALYMGVLAAPVTYFVVKRALTDNQYSVESDQILEK
jgi:hypothetical protein